MPVQVNQVNQGGKKLCENCGEICRRKTSFESFKPPDFHRYKHICFTCILSIGWDDGKYLEFIKEKFRKDGWVGDRL